jgi:uncharacterized protein
MYLFDVNVWVHAHREDSARHGEIAPFVRDVLNSSKPFAYSPLVLSGFLRVVTHPRVFTLPTPFDTAMAFADSIAGHPCSYPVLPGAAHWNIFTHLCYAVKPSGNLFPDTFFAALAIESGCTFVTCDRGFKQFPSLALKFL